MKKLLTVLIILTVCFAAFAGGAQETEESNVLTVAATPEPHASMLNLVKDDLAAQGITLVVKEFTDYVVPNTAVEEGEVDANFFQHKPYMDSFNKDRGYHLVSAGGIHIEPLALYSQKISSIDELEKGSTIAVPNDPTNEGRALLLLQSVGLIKLSEDAGLEATPFNIVSNPYELKFTELEAATIPRVLKDVDAAIINGNYAIPAGLNAKKDGLIVEGADSPYVNIVAVKEGHENDPNIKALVKALQSDKVKNWVSETYPNGGVVTVF